MHYRGCKSSGGIAALIVIALAASAATPSTAAELCSTGVAGVATSCEAAFGLARDLAQGRSDRTLAIDPTKDRARRLDGSYGAGDGAPFAMSGDNDNVNFNTSLKQWGSAFSAADLESLKQAQTLIGGDASLPKAGKPRAPKFDLWAQGRSQRFIDDGTKRGNAVTTTLGADYRWDRNLLIGGMVQLDGSHQTILASPDATAGSAYLAGPYLAYRLSPNVVLDAKAAWGTAHDSAASGAANIDLTANRMLSGARLTGQWGWNAWQLSQSGAVTYFDETSHGIAPMQASSAGITRFSVGPELKRHIDTGNGASIEPFAFFRSSWISRNRIGRLRWGRTRSAAACCWPGLTNTRSARRPTSPRA